MTTNDGRVIPSFINQALRGQDITIFGDGSQTRCFCYIDDLVNGIDSLLFSKYSLPINLGSDDEISILELANEIISLTKSKSIVKYLDLPENDPIRRKPDLSKVKKELLWNTKVKRKEGLLYVIEYFKSLL